MPCANIVYLLEFSGLILNKVQLYFCKGPQIIFVFIKTNT